MNHGYHGDTYCTSIPGSDTGRVVILPDFPDTNTYESVMHWVSQRGQTALYPRYPGSMQSHGAFLGEHPGRSVQRVTDELTEKPVLLGIGFGSLVALSVAARTDVAGLILYDPWWDIDLLDDPEEYLRTAFKHHHYLYRDERSGLPESLRDFDDLYPYSYVDDVDTSILVFISEDPSVPREATAEMQELLDLTVVEHTAVSVNQCFIQHMDRVYSYLNEATL